MLMIKRVLCVFNEDTQTELVTNSQTSPKQMATTENSPTKTLDAGQTLGAFTALQRTNSNSSQI